jgi:hypothetical protein
MPSAEYDLVYLENAIQLLEDYLLSKDLFWQMRANPPPGEIPFPSQTLAGVLLARARADAWNLTGDLKSRMIKVNFEIDRIRNKWRTAWEKKAEQEHSSRLKLWRNYLEDYRQDPKSNANRYAYEVNRRVALDLLENEFDEMQNVEQELLTALDRMLNGILQPGDFVWEKELAEGFPSSEYPYLYGNLRS